MAKKEPKLWKAKVNVKSHPAHEKYKVEVRFNTDTSKPLVWTVKVSDTGYAYDYMLSGGTLRSRVSKPENTPELTTAMDNDSLYHFFYTSTFDKPFFQDIYSYMESDEYIEDYLAGKCDINERITQRVQDYKPVLKDTIEKYVSMIRVAYWQQLRYCQLNCDFHTWNEYVPEFDRIGSKFKYIVDVLNFMDLVKDKAPVKYDWGPLDPKKSEDKRIYNV